MVPHTCSSTADRRHPPIRLHQAPDHLDGEQRDVALDLKQVEDQGQADADEIQHHRPTDGADDPVGHLRIHGCKVHGEKLLTRPMKFGKAEYCRNQS